MKIWSCLHQDCAQVNCEQAAALPDYYPPVMRVVQVLCEPCVTEVRESDGAVTVSGEATLSLLYQTEDEKGLCSYRTSVNFSQMFSLPEDCSGQYDAHVKSQGVTCRLTSARRVSFKAVLAVYLTVSGEKELGAPEANEDMLYLISSVKGLVGRGCVCRRFHITERGESDCIPAAALSTKASAMVQEISSAGGKTLIKGEVSVRTLYVTKDDEVGCVRFTFPLSQLLDIPSGEGIETDVTVRVGNIEVEIGENMDGSKGRFSYEIDLSATACSTECKQFDLACDAFSKTHALDLAREKVTLCAPNARLRGTVETTVSVPVEADLGEVIEAEATVQSCAAKCDGGRLVLEGECAIVLLHCEENGRIHAREMTLPFTAHGPAIKEGKLSCQVCVWSAQAGQDGVRLQLKYEAVSYQERVCEYLKSATPDLNRPLPEFHKSPVTLYFAEKGEAIWDIAKKYRTSPQKICADNKLDCDVMAQAERLLIL